MADRPRFDEFASSGLPFSMEHRPWPVPHFSWALRQVWNHVLFVHWKFPEDAVRRTLPAALAPWLDTYEGSAWIGIVGFGVTGTRMRGLPSIPGLSDFTELNVRTYVTIGGKPGVYFYSLDTENLLAIAGARALFDLPYFPSTTELIGEGGGFFIGSQRWSRGRPSFNAAYHAVGAASPAINEPLTLFLAERYCLYTADDAGRVDRADIAHRPWPISKADVDIHRNGMLGTVGLDAPTEPPLAHFAERQEAFIWRPRRVDVSAESRQSPVERLV